MYLLKNDVDEEAETESMLTKAEGGNLSGHDVGQRCPANGETNTKDCNHGHDAPLAGCRQRSRLCSNTAHCEQCSNHDNTRHKQACPATNFVRRDKDSNDNNDRDARVEQTEQRRVERVERLDVDSTVLGDEALARRLLEEVDDDDNERADQVGAAKDILERAFFRLTLQLLLDLNKLLINGFLGIITGSALAQEAQVVPGFVDAVLLQKPARRLGHKPNA